MKNFAVVMIDGDLFVRENPENKLKGERNSAGEKIIFTGTQEECSAEIRKVIYGK